QLPVACLGNLLCELLGVDRVEVGVGVGQRHVPLRLSHGAGNAEAGKRRPQGQGDCFHDSLRRLTLASVPARRLVDYRAILAARGLRASVSSFSCAAHSAPGLNDNTGASLVAAARNSGSSRISRISVSKRWAISGGMPLGPAKPRSEAMDTSIPDSAAVGTSAKRSVRSSAS